MSLAHFAEKWLPVISGTEPQDMMTIKVAYPFEWNCYETWKVVWRVRFDFSNVSERTRRGLGTLTDVMNGWQSKYHEDFCRIDHEALAYYSARTGHDYEIGDNTYREMRELIQSPIGMPQVTPPSLHLLDEEP
jgi:hypothetical protein